MTLKKVLLVEGKDDEHVLKHLSGNRGGPQFDEVRPLGGIDRLLEVIPVYWKSIADTAIVGIVVDADTDAASRWQALRDRLVKIGYEDFPQQPHRDGTVIDPLREARLPRVGIWMMPDNRNTGILEDFLRFLVPVGSPLLHHVIASIANIPKAELRFSQLDEPKAVIHTWLAWQEEPGRPLGTAITARYLDPNMPEADVLVAWLNRLYET